MHRFFIFNEQTEPTKRIVPTNELLHQLTKVLRIRKNEEFVCIYKNLELRCLLDGSEVIVISADEFEVNKERKITLIQGIPTNKKVSIVLQKTTELDVDEIVLWQAERSTSKLIDFNKKEERLNKIIIEACEQSRRNDIPRLSFINSLEEFDFKNSKTIILYENENSKTFKEAISDCGNEDINVVIGPEGGITENEIKTFIEKGSIIATTGKNILRTETAAIAAIAMLVYQIR